MSEPIPTDPVVDPDFPPEEPVPPEPDPVEPGPEMPVVKGWIDQIADAESRAAVEALRVATAEAEREAGEAEAAAKAYADLIDTGASDADIAAARAYAEEQAEEARVAAEAAAALDATGKADAAEQAAVVAAEADAAAKATQAVTDAGAYTDTQIPLVAGRLVPRNMDRAPTVEDGADLVAGTGWNQYDPTTNDLVQMWRWDGAAWQALDMSAEMIPVLDIGSATVGDLIGGRINVQDGPIVAGDPAGARVEITGDGFHAYDATGAETARIQGDEGVFVGGEFRTSDTLPGQVTLSDTAAGGGPGIGVTPVNSAGYAALPSVGPAHDGIRISGGEALTGSSSFVIAQPLLVALQARDADGTRGEISVSRNIAQLARTEPGGPRGEVAVYPGFSLLEYQRDGVTRRLTVDKDGVWVQTDEGGTWKNTNLLGTTWTNLTLLNGWQAYTGGGGYFNGLRAQRTPLGIRVDGMIQSGTTGVIAVLPDSMQDVAAKQFTAVASVSGRESAYLAVARSTAHGDKYAVHYLQGPSAPNYVSVSTDAALL